MFRKVVRLVVDLDLSTREDVNFLIHHPPVDMVIRPHVTRRCDGTLLWILVLFCMLHQCPFLVLTLVSVFVVTVFV